MEQFVLGFFQEHLSKFIVGFRKEQVNANLLNGKGEIKDVSLNCAMVNDAISTVTPFIELESVHVSRLSFNVSSWANLKKAPIQVVVEDVTAVIVEPLHYIEKSKRRTLKQLTREEFLKLIDGKKPRGSYNLFDRIGDNIEVSVRSVNISFQTRGKFKTRRSGPWSPPQLVLTLKHFRYCSVDEDGNEASPDDCWKHNKFTGPMETRSIMIYKKVSMFVTLGLKSAGKPPSPPLLKDGQVSVQIAFHKRVRDAAILAIQVDITMNRVGVQIDDKAIPEMAHMAAGMKFCFAKDRVFEDPLIGEHETASTRNLAKLTASVSMIEDSPDEDDDDNKAQTDISDILEEEERGVESEMTKSDAPSVPLSPQRTRTTDRPVLITPAGIVLHERLSVSLSVHDCVVRGSYAEREDPMDNGYVLIKVKGMIAELMWPKVTLDKGCHLQMSLAYLSIQERMGQRSRFLIIGGMHEEMNRFPVERPSGAPAEIPRDENFPLFEDRCIRPDPLGLRHTFPAQALGVKSTVNYVEKVSAPGEMDVMVLNEVGVDKFEIVIDSESWCRILRFAANEDGGGFDPRWTSGDWSDVLTSDLLRHPGKTLNLDDHTQEAKTLFVDENHMISSDLFNLTARITNIELRLAAAIQRDIRACDVKIRMGEMMVIVSSALPRTTLSGKIGSSIDEEPVSDRSKIKFPNDENDICYQLEVSEDPLVRQQGAATRRIVSTFRVQITFHGVQINLIPVIPFCNAPEPQELLMPLEMAMIFCFEGEPPVTPNEDLMKLFMFVSLEIGRLEFNFDFDLLAGTSQTAMFHAENFLAVFHNITETFKKQEALHSVENIDKSSGDSNGIKNRRVLVRRQFKKSWETGGVSVSCCMQLAKLGVRFWRQNVPSTTRFRASVTEDSGLSTEKTLIPLIKLFDIHLHGLEVGAELTLNQGRRRLIGKTCLSSFGFSVCDFDAETASVMSSGDNQTKGAEKRAMVQIFGLGLSPESESKDVSIRVEERFESESSVVAASVDVAARGDLTLHVHALETTFLLVVEALLMPSGERIQVPAGGTKETILPVGTIGHMLSTFAALFSSRVEHTQLSPVVSDIVNETFDINLILQKNLIDNMPSAVSALLIRASIGGFSLYVPQLAEETAWSGVSLCDATLVSHFFRNETVIQNEIFSTVASPQGTWNNLSLSHDPGLHHSLVSRQSLHLAAGDESGQGTLLSEIVPTFEIVGRCSPSSATLSMGDSLLSVPDLQKINAVYGSMKGLAERTGHTVDRVASVARALRTQGAEGFTDKEPRRHSENGTANHEVQRSLLRATPSLRSSQQFLQQIRCLVEAQQFRLHRLLSEKISEIDKLRVTVFQKERARLAALALVAHQAAGWLRVGGQHMRGERAPSTSTMWPFYSVLRKSLLILYSGPSDPTPVDIVSLKGARLRPLAGGRRKLDVKTGFVLVENTGKVRFAIAPTEREFEVWVGKLQSAMAAYATDDDVSVDSANTAVAEEQFDGPMEPFGMESVEGSRHGGDDEISSTSPSPARGQHVRSKLTDVTSSTKTRLETAVQAARQRMSPTDAEPRRRLQSASSDQFEPNNPSANLQTELTQDEAVDFTSGVDDLVGESNAVETDAAVLNTVDDAGAGSAIMGTRFSNFGAGAKNRFGNAVQAAREKAEQRRKRREDDDGQSSSIAQQQLDEGAGGRRTPRLGGFRNRMGKVAASVKTRIDKGEASAMTEQTSLAETETTNPEAVTVDPSELESVESSEALDQLAMAAQESKSTDDEADQYTIQDQGDGGESVAGESITGDSVASTRRDHIRQRMSKFGASVTSRRVRPKEDSSSMGRFSLRRRATSGDDDGAPTKLKGLRIGEGQPNILASDRPNREVPLSKIEGNWFVKVDSRDLDGIDLEASSAAASDTNDSVGADDGIGPAENPVNSSYNGAANVRYGFKVFAFADEVHSGEQSRRFESTLRSFTEMLLLYSNIAEALSELPDEQKRSLSELRDAGAEMRSDVAAMLGLTPLDSVRLTGHLLGGLIYADLKFQRVEGYREYQCEVLTEFLNSILSCPLPESVCTAMARFIGIDAAIHSSEAPPTKSRTQTDSELVSLEKVSLEANSLFAAIGACETELNRAIVGTEHAAPSKAKGGHQIFLADQGALSSKNGSLNPYMGPLLDENVTGSIRDALHDALMSAMAERDEAQTQLIASSVLHVHEMEQERRNVDILTSKLRVMEELARETVENDPLGPLNTFNRDGRRRQEAAQAKSTRNLQTLAQEQRKSMDEELVGLCQQLSKEIASKTAKSLEVVRLQESRKLEREQHEAEKAALEVELRKARQELLELKTKT